MSFTDNFGHPRGLLGRLMLVTYGKRTSADGKMGVQPF